jgi:uncharacterized membrane protein
MNRTLANRILFLLALAGLGVSLYLTIAHLRQMDMPCGADGGCEKVAQHYTAKGFGIPGLERIPTAAFGAGMYVVLAALSFGRVLAAGTAKDRKLANFQWLICAVGVAVSGWLTYLEAAVIHAWCRFCVASAVIILLSFIVSSAERFAPGQAALPAGGPLPEREVP